MQCASQQAAVKNPICLVDCRGDRDF